MGAGWFAHTGLGANLMLNRGTRRQMYRLVLIEDSPLRRVDPRVKLAMGLCASLAVMLPLERLVIFLAVYALFLGWARLLPAAARQVWRMRWLLLMLFLLDVWLIDLELAVAVTLRLVLLAGVFSLLVATTTPRELSLALESLRLPYRYAFSLGLAFQSLSLMDEEWRMIEEAQRARGVWPVGKDWRQLLRQTRNLVAFTVPAIVLTTKRAWMITEAAYARGFDSPHRRPSQKLSLGVRDWLLLAGVILVLGLFFGVKL
jgi:energy-coupling factor transporter transmembrane protein EcfT